MQFLNNHTYRRLCLSANHFWLPGLLILMSNLVGNYCYAQRPQITFSCGIGSDLPVYKEIETRYLQAFAAMGYEFTMVPLSGQRSLANANNGVTDGECARVYNFSEIHPESHLIRVNVLMGTTELSVWSFTDKIKINNADDIKKGNFRVGIPLGTVMSEKFVADNHLENITHSGSSVTSIKMLSAQRFDLLIAPSDLIRQQLPGMTLKAPIYKVGVLARVKIYPFIHDSKRELIPRFTTELQKRVAPEGVPLN